MDMTQLMGVFSDPEMINSLSAVEKLKGIFVTVVLGMGITFLALVILKYCIDIMTKLTVPNVVVIKEKAAAPISAPVVEEAPSNDEELVAVISAAIAAQLGTSTQNIVIKNIERSNYRTTSWSKTGIIEQMNNRM